MPMPPFKVRDGLVNGGDDGRLRCRGKSLRRTAVEFKAHKEVRHYGVVTPLHKSVLNLCAGCQRNVALGAQSPAKYHYIQNKHPIA